MSSTLQALTPAATITTGDLFYISRSPYGTGDDRSVTDAVLAEFIQDTMNATLVGGSNISVTYNDPSNTITIAYTGAPPPADTDDLPEGATNLYFINERAQDAVGAMVDATLVYVDGTPLLTRAALTGDVTAPQASNVTTIANDAVTFAKFQNAPAAGYVGATAAGDYSNRTFEQVRSDISVAEALTANRTYYVRTDGSDSNTGLVDSAGGAFLTIQKGIDTAATLLLNGFTVTIQVRDGTFVGDVSLKSITGGRVIVQGNTTTPTNVVIQRSAAIAAVLGIGIVGTYTFQGFTFAGTPGAWIRVDGPGVNFTFNTITFPLLTGGIHILSLDGAIVQSDGNYTISGGGATFMQTSVQGMIVDLAARTITVSGTPAWSFGFAVASANSTIRYPNKTYSGAATGVRYRTIENSVISVGGSATYFPGDVAGITATGGQYV